MDKADSLQKEMGNVNREVEILRKNKIEILEIKKAITEVKNTFNVLIGRLDTDEKRISELEEILMETSKTEKQREKKGCGEEDKKECPRTVGQL